MCNCLTCARIRILKVCVYKQSSGRSWQRIGSENRVAFGRAVPQTMVHVGSCTRCHRGDPRQVSHSLSPVPAGSTASPQHTKGQNPWDLILSNLSKMKYYHPTLTDNSTSQLQKKYLQGNVIHKDFWETNKIISK